MKIGIVGSRGYKSIKKIHELMSSFDSSSVIVSGGAPGVDSIAESYAKKIGLTIEIYPADWNTITHSDSIVRVNKYGKKYDAFAGMRRNKLIVEASDVIYAFWDGKSPGTLSTIRLAKQLGKPIIIIQDEQ